MTLISVKERLNQLCSDLGRLEGSVRLIAVSKTKSPHEITDVFALGQRDFGENYVEELATKAQALKPLKDIRWVFIGQLQSNKIQKLVTLADEIQTLASEKHARYTERYVKESGKDRFPVWIHVNAEDEGQKFGISVSEVPGLAKFILEQCPHLVLQGIMAIPPATYCDEAFSEAPKLYQDLVKLARTVGLGKISLGMSADLGIALRAGSDCVRIGSALFGPRQH